MLRKGLESELLRINEAIDSISVEEKNKLISKYIGSEYQIERQYSTLRKVFLIAFIALIVVFLLFYVRSRKYKIKSERDALTGVYNRGTIEEKIEEISKNTNGSVIFLDIDHFKKINDTYGHDVGDFVLKRLSYLIKNSIPPGNVFGRWGGEEFILVLPDVNYGNAYFVAEKLRKMVEESDFNGMKVTMSVGVSEFKKGEDINEAIKKADEALYEAKESGRNQVKGKR
jgi:diguanylate cyclase (GGDEF)-like protein